MLKVPSDWLNLRRNLWALNYFKCMAVIEALSRASQKAFKLLIIAAINQAVHQNHHCLANQNGERMLLGLSG